MNDKLLKDFAMVQLNLEALFNSDKEQFIAKYLNLIHQKNQIVAELNTAAEKEQEEPTID